MATTRVPPRRNKGNTRSRRAVVHQRQRLVIRLEGAAIHQGHASLGGQRHLQVDRLDVAPLQQHLPQQTAAGLAELLLQGLVQGLGLQEPMQHQQIAQAVGGAQRTQAGGGLPDDIGRTQHEPRAVGVGGGTQAGDSGGRRRGGRRGGRRR
jgi:hypothetical protein